MSRLTSQQRKLAYLVIIVILLIPVIFLGRPSAPGSKGREPDAGGWLASLRSEYDLGEQSFGNVDPSSATMNLVLLGLRGPAANLLWMELDHYKDTKNWSRMLSTTNSIILLQPHFQKVWVFNGWNLAFNVSMEWDDVRDRYYWVKEGAKFFKLGTKPQPSASPNSTGTPATPSARKSATPMKRTSSGSSSRRTPTRNSPSMTKMALIAN
ncbi:MAG: hypothetical protein U0903_21425 [Planctomycetales bacterium]